jgi:hypothetical protein
VLDLVDELTAILERLDDSGIPYALCGGLAMAVWEMPRATVDIDLLVETDAIERIVTAVQPLGFIFRARTMRFSDGAVVIDRVSKIDPVTHDALVLDLLHVTAALTDVWSTRVDLEWERGKLTVVSREGLIKLKSFRSSGQDMDDIRKLKGEL